MTKFDDHLCPRCNRRHAYYRTCDALTPEMFAEYREGGEFEPLWDEFSRAFDATFERIHLEIRPFDPHL